jgi:general secretion pathway protein G
MKGVKGLSMENVILFFRAVKPRFIGFWTIYTKFYSGFTLIEIMVVMVILGILAGLIIPRIMGRPEEARRMKAQIQIESIETALQLYRLDNGSYPTTEQGLQALVEPPSVGQLPKAWREGGYLEKGKVPKDPWINEYVYLCPGIHGDFDLISYGADGQPGGEDKDQDINNWELE